MLKTSTLATQTLRTLQHSKIYKRKFAKVSPLITIEIYKRYFLNFDAVASESTGTSYRTESVCYKDSHDHTLGKYSSLHVNYLLFLSHFRRNRSVSKKFSKTSQISCVMKLRPAGVFLVHADKQTDSQTDMTQPIVVLRNF
jgi:hypothetical protein